MHEPEFERAAVATSAAGAQPPPPPDGVPTLSPPPAPTLDPGPDEVQRLLLVCVSVLGVAAIAAGSLLEWKEAPLLRQGGWFCVIYAAIVASSWLPEGRLSVRVDRLLDRWVRNSGSGYYGLMALAVFVPLELASTWQALTGWEWSREAIGSAVMQWITGFSMDSLRNFISAMIWPGHLVPEYGVGRAGVLFAATWGLFELGRRRLPQLRFDPARRAPGKEEKKKRKSRSS